VTAVHAWVTCLNGVRYYSTFVVAAEHVVTLVQGDNLLIAEGVLNDNDMAEIFGLDILVILANTYCKTLAAVFAFKNQRLSHLVTTCIKVNGMVTLGAYYLAHKRFV
jgi:hypothetical protein